MRKFFVAILVLLAAFTVQFFFASLGFSFDLAFAALVAFAFILSWPELIILDLIAILILNWQPALSAILIMYGFFPLAIVLLKNIFPWQPRFGIPIAVAFCAVFIATLGMPFRLVGFGAILENTLVMMLFSCLVSFVISFA